jgi:hypothetical protein
LYGVDVVVYIVYMAGSPKFLLVGGVRYVLVLLWLGDVYGWFAKKVLWWRCGEGGREGGRDGCIEVSRQKFFLFLILYLPSTT